MASSDEEGEVYPDSVTDYEFVNQENEHISFAFLPLQWRNDESIDTVNLQMFISGVCDGGLQKIYKQVVAWRYELAYVQPEISVLCKGNLWVKLLKPKKLFEATIRSILITIQCLHFVKHNPQATKNSIWCHLSRVFRFECCLWYYYLVLQYVLIITLHNVSTINYLTINYPTINYHVL